MHYPIRTVSTMTGIKPVTLRAWETRYGLLHPLRTESGHRLYSDRDIETIQRALALRARGIPIRQVPAILKQETTTIEIGTNWQQSQDGMLAAINEFNEAEIDRLYQRAMGLHPITTVIGNLIEPVLRTLGDRWSSAQAGIAEEHFFRVYVSHKLEARFQQQFGRATGPLIVTACLPRESHELGLSLFCLAAHEANYRVVNLGADTPLQQIEVVCRRTNPSAIVLAGLKSPGIETLTELAKLSSNVTIPVCVGGQASVSAAAAIKHSGVILLGNNPSAALRQITELMTSQANHRKPESPQS